MARNLVRASSSILYQDNVTAPYAAIVSAFPFTVSAWYYPTTLVSGEFYSILAGAAPSFSDYYMLLIHEDTPGVFRLKAQVAPSGHGFGSWPFTSNAVTLNAWNHCAFSATQATRSMFLNGVKTVDAAASATNYSGLTQTTIGGLVDVTTAANLHNINGPVAQCGWWNVALDDDEMIALSKGVTPPLIRPQSLVGYFPVTGNESPELDRSRNGRVLVASGSFAKADDPSLYYQTGAQRLSANAGAYTLAVDTGVYSLTGSVITFPHGYTLSALPGAYALSGLIAILSRPVKARHRITGSYSANQIILGSFNKRRRPIG